MTPQILLQLAKHAATYAKHMMGCQKFHPKNPGPCSCGLLDLHRDIFAMELMVKGINPEELSDDDTKRSAGVVDSPGDSSVLDLGLYDTEGTKTGRFTSSTSPGGDRVPQETEAPEPREEPLPRRDSPSEWAEDNMDSDQLPEGQGDR